MYEQSSILTAGILLVSMAVAIEGGYRIGIRYAVSAAESSKTHVNAIQASLLGVLALLLGFTFSLSLQRFDKRSDAVVAEANAIGTTYLRAQLLPASIRDEVQQLLREYLDLRVRASATTLIDQAARAALFAEVNLKLDMLWRYARQAAEQDSRPVTSGLFIQSLNELIDAYGRRSAVLDQHVPEVVLFLLYGTFLMTGSLVGYASGVAGHRASLATYILVVLIVLLVFIIIDLDRPRRGLIEVSQQSLTDLRAVLEGGPMPAPGETTPAGGSGHPR